MYNFPDALFDKCLDIPPACLRVAIKLWNLKKGGMDDPESVSMSLPKLCEETKLSLPTVRKSLKHLQSVGILEIEKFDGLGSVYHLSGF